ncbi:MAG: BACON domain-containing protein [Paludibacteraceae bacterium]|nr:BACON domain-containing protein [Paludibacteraceae bacterium]
MKKNLLKKMWISITMLMLFSTAAMSQDICDYPMTSENGYSITVSCYSDDSGYHMKFVDEAEMFDFDADFSPFDETKIKIGTKNVALNNYFSLTDSNPKELICNIPSGVSGVPFIGSIVIWVNGDYETFNDLTTTYVNWDATCEGGISAVMVDATELKFSPTRENPQTVFVTGNGLTNDVTISCDDPDVFSVTPSSIPLDEVMTSGATVYITCNATEDVESTIYFQSEGSSEFRLSVSYHVPQKIEFTSDCNIDGQVVSLYFTGYGDKYERDESKYTATVTSTNPSITSIGVYSAMWDYLYCYLDDAPDEDDITQITLEYENEDSGTITFKGGQIAVPSISVTPTELALNAVKTSGAVNVTAQNLTTDVTISSNNADITVFPTSITKEEAMAGAVEVKITSNAIVNTSATITISSGTASQNVAVTYTAPSPVYNADQDKWYDLLGNALNEAVAGDQIMLFQDINEAVTIDKYIKLSGGGNAVKKVTVDIAGKLEFTGTANFDTFIIKSQPNVGAGQVLSNGNTITANEAYMERQIYSGAYQQYWYSLSVPFTVDANEGLYTVDGNKIPKNTCFFTEYDGSLRAEYGVATLGQPGYAWVETTNLIRGKAYMVYIMDETINTLRFKATVPNELFNNVDIEAVAFTKFEGAAAETDWGWNFMAQPRLQNAKVQVTAGAWGSDEVLIQVLQNGGNDADSDGGASYYSTMSSKALVMAPFTSFMFQASATGNMNFLYTSAEPTFKSAEVPECKYFVVNLSDENGNSDSFFASASEDAKIEGYELGRDLVKCGSSDNSLQICSSDFDLILTANDARLNGGVAEMPLRLSIPKAGIYSLQVTRAATFGEIYLTKNGEVIADLTDGDVFQFAAVKGVNNQFGLRIENGGDIATTAGDEKSDINVYATEGIIYVNGVKAAEVRNMLGQQVNNQNLHRGSYIVNAEGSIIKINVE